MAIGLFSFKSSAKAPLKIEKYDQNSFKIDYNSNKCEAGLIEKLIQLTEMRQKKNTLN